MYAYVVIDYNDVKAVFDRESEANSYATYHNYHRVERYDMNPGHGGWPDGLHYCLTYHIAGDQWVMYRVTNDSTFSSGWKATGTENKEGPHHVRCYFRHKNECATEARQHASELVDALRDGVAPFEMLRIEETLEVAEGETPDTLGEFFDNMSVTNPPKLVLVKHIDSYRLQDGEALLTESKQVHSCTN